MTDAADVLRKTVAASAPLLEALAEEATGCPRAPGKWSPREVLGHLVDSAANNHIRFVRGQFEEDLIFESYDQDEWVRVQAYCDAPWTEIVELWRAYNCSSPGSSKRFPRTSGGGPGRVTIFIASGGRSFRKKIRRASTN
ncbi:MAG: DinB family protein [Acidobacteriota bacterium]|nr:DinB family protein [Acidobacteriota bacterium]